MKKDKQKTEQNDNFFRHIEKIENTHDKYTYLYVHILNTYRGQLETSVKTKNNLQNKFYILITGFMIGLTVLFCGSVIASFVLFFIMLKMNYTSAYMVSGAITATVSSFATAIAALFKLPEIVAKYLFNKDEDKAMNEIIKNIQEYEINAVRLNDRTEIDVNGNADMTIRRDEASVIDVPKTGGGEPADEEDEEKNEIG